MSWPRRFCLLLALLRSGAKTCGTRGEDSLLVSSKLAAMTATEGYIPIPTAAASGLLPKRVVGRVSLSRGLILSGFLNEERFVDWKL